MPPPAFLVAPPARARAEATPDGLFIDDPFGGCKGQRQSAT
jgi:hypothetical protein